MSRSSLPLHAALLQAGGAPASDSDPFAEGGPPLQPAHFGGPAGFTAMHAAALANAPVAIRALAAAGCPVDAPLDEGVEWDEELDQLLKAATAPGARRAAALSVRGGASPLALAVLARRPDAARALLAAGADARQRLVAHTRRWSSNLPLLMYCVWDPEEERRMWHGCEGQEAEQLQVMEALLEVRAPGRVSGAGTREACVHTNGLFRCPP